MVAEGLQDRFVQLKPCSDKGFRVKGLRSWKGFEGLGVIGKRV